jgi:hypothetical protein
MAPAKDGDRVDVGGLQRAHELDRIEIHAYLGNLGRGVKVEVYLPKRV